MKPNESASTAVAETVVPALTVLPSPTREARDTRFKIISFENRGGSKSWRVAGIKRDGKRVRANFNDEKAAQCKRAELEAEYHARTDSDIALRATRLTDVQIRLAETAFIRLDADEEILRAVEYWLQHGRQQSVTESKRLDEAVTEFKKWLEATDTLRKRSKDFLRTQVQIFQNSVPNLRLPDISADIIDKFLDGRNVSTQTRVNSRLAVSRFFSWCIDRPRRWAAFNPCRDIRIKKNGNSSLPPIMTVDECADLLKAAEKFRRGKFAPYIAVCLFGGLRPAEAQRLTWDKVNLTDGEIRIESQSTKTKKPRVVTMDKTLKAWLKAFKNKPFNPTNRRRHLDKLKQAAGYSGRITTETDGLKPWPHDVLRHTGISHFFRKTGSYGLAAEQFGNSESIIKRHYQGRVTSEDTKKFYALMPTKKAKRKGGRK